MVNFIFIFFDFYFIFHFRLQVGYCSITGANTDPAQCSAVALNLTAQAVLYTALFEVGHLRHLTLVTIVARFALIPLSLLSLTRHCNLQGERCVIKDCCQVLDGTILAPGTVIPPFTVFGGQPGNTDHASIGCLPLLCACVRAPVWFLAPLFILCACVCFLFHLLSFTGRFIKKLPESFQATWTQHTIEYYRHFKANPKDATSPRAAQS